MFTFGEQHPVGNHQVVNAVTSVSQGTINGNLMYCWFQSIVVNGNYEHKSLSNNFFAVEGDTLSGLQVQLSILTAKVDLCLDLLRANVQKRQLKSDRAASIRLPLTNLVEMDNLHDQIQDRKSDARTELVRNTT